MSSKKALILYYSGGGKTQKMAKAIAEAMRGSRIIRQNTIHKLASPDLNVLKWISLGGLYILTTNHILASPSRCFPSLLSSGLFENSFSSPFSTLP
jgi:hypothetical protein